MNTVIFDRIYLDICNALKNAKIDVDVSTELKNDSYPCVVIDNAINDNLSSSTCQFEKTDLLDICIDIYCNEQEIENVVYSGRSIAIHISKLIDDVCSQKYRLKRSMKSTPNVDDSIYRITLHYVSKINPNRNTIF